MKTFRCQCGNRLFFGNTLCLACGRALGFAPDRNAVMALEGPTDDGLWHAADGASPGAYRFCSHRDEIGCDWLVPEAQTNPQCLSCRLTAVIPNLDLADNRVYWRRLETAKRYLVSDILRLGLPVTDWQADPDLGLGFEFLADQQTAEGLRPVMTGHMSGRITVNVAEADHVHRERVRVALGEAYRTLLGHMRHESGHYYWFRLVSREGERLAAFRECFGDERVDYKAAMSAYYDTGPPDDWARTHISAYAASHPWEDWAESWAHYLHITDAMDTARAFGLAAAEKAPDTIDERLEQWSELALALNALSRSLGLPDPYPFNLTPAATGKLRLIHAIIQDASGDSRSRTGRASKSDFNPSLHASRTRIR